MYQTIHGLEHQLEKANETHFSLVKYENGKENAKESDQLENDWHEAGRDDGFEAGLLVDPGPDDELGVGTTRPVWANQKLLLRVSSFVQNVIWFSDKESISIISNKAAMYNDANY